MRLISSGVSSNGVKRKTFYDPVTDGTTFYAEQDVNQIIKDNAHQRELDPSGAIGGAHVRVASIPMVQVLEWKKQGFDIFDRNNDQLLLRMLRQPDLRDLRTSEVKI